MRATVALAAVTMLAAACGNASSSSDAKKTPTTGTQTPATIASPEALATKVDVKAPGVTNDEIHVATITDTTNILGGHYAELNDGIQAYFDWVNGNGGIYGRKLVITKKRDSKMTATLQEIKNSLASDNAFATFVATTLLTGADQLDKAGMPSFIWNINPQMAGHDNIFGNVGALCFGCTGQFLPWLAKQRGYTSVGILGYGVSSESQLCAQGNRDSFKKYAPEIKIGVFDDKIGYAEPNLGPQVTDMRKAGVQFVMTCMDANETLVLAKEMKKQGLNAIQILPNAYDQQFIADNAQYYEGSLVSTVFLPYEKAPDSLPALEKTFLAQTAGKPRYELTAVGWILADEFVTGLKLAGPQFSQQKVIDSLNTLKAYTAGGMSRPTDWTKQHNDPTNDPSVRGKWEGCFGMVEVRSGKFVPVYDQPGKPWMCAPSYDAPVADPTYENFEHIDIRTGEQRSG